MNYSVETYKTSTVGGGMNTVFEVLIEDIRIIYRYRIYGRGITNHQVFEDFIRLRHVLIEASTMKLLSLLKSNAFEKECETELLKLRLSNMDYDFSDFLDVFAEKIKYYKNI